MKRLGFVLARGLAAAALAEPTVTVDSFVQLPSRLVKVAFTVSEAAIVTFDVETNGVSVGGANLQTVEGPVNRMAAAGSHSLRWWPADERWDRPANATSAWCPPRLDNARAVFRVWEAARPPRYLVIDLETKEFTYYDDAGAIPGGVTADRYKTDCLVLRLCPKTDCYMMGSANPWGTDHWIQGKRKPYHAVKFTRDFYLGVYEFTQGQYKKALDVAPDCQWGGGDLRFPVDGKNSSLGQNRLRGANTWPEGGHDAVTDDSILGRLRAKYGLAFDLPTEAQWEYACRGGREGCTLYNRDGFILSTKDENGNEDEEIKRCLDEIAVCYLNATAETGPCPVGTKAPNDWGFYDMLGNLQEWCLDYGPESNDFYQQCVDNPALAIDPVGTTTEAGTRIMRGGSYYQGFWNMTCTARSAPGATWTNESIGFRLAVELPGGEEGQ